MEKIRCADSVKKRGIAKSQVGKKRPIYNKTKEESVD
jgi:hypothetical protein